MAAKRKASAMAATVDEESVDPSDELAFYCLGGGNEVGRSCHIIQYKGKTVMVSLHASLLRNCSLSLTILLLLQLDAGMHPAKDGFAALPFFDEFDLSTVDILLLSQYVFCIFLATYPMSFRIFFSFFRQARKTICFRARRCASDCIHFSWPRNYTHICLVYIRNECIL